MNISKLKMELKPVSSQASSLSAQKTKTKTILLVEDEVISAMAEATSLEKEGFSVITAYNGEEAVEYATRNTGIDLILMDIDLGAGMDGTRAAAIILKYIDIPVLFLSSHTEPEIVEKTEKITSYGYVVKNSGKTVLLASIKMAFKLHEANRKLQMTSDNFSTVFHLNPVAMTITQIDSNLISDVNKAFSRLSGYSEAEVVGKNALKDLNIWVDPEDRHNMVRDLKRNGRVDGLELMFRMKDGTLRIVEAAGELITYNNKPSMLGIWHDFTERKRAEELLRESEGRYRTLFENATEGLFLTTTEGRYINVNPSAARMFRYSSPEDMINSVTDIGRQIYAHPEDRDTFISIMAEQGKCEGMEVEMVRKDKNRIWIRMNVHVVRDGQGNILHYDGTCVDITESRRIEEALKKSENEFKSLFDASPTGIGLLKDRRLLKVNTQLVKMLGYTPDDLLGKSVQEFYADDDEFNRVGETIYGMVEQSGVGEIETRLRNKSGLMIDVYIRASAVDRHDAAAGTIITVQDITERKRAEEALGKALQEKETLFHELQHRMKNTLMMIKSILSIEIEHSGRADTQAVLENIKGRIESLAFLYTILSQSKSLTEVSLDEYINSIAVSLADSCISGINSVKIEKQCDHLVTNVKSAAAWGLIVNELLTNALKYAYPKGESGVILIQLKKRDSDIMLSISDTGAGPAADFDIDEPKGLGLLLVKMLARQLGGELSFKRGKDNVFMITAPL
ncbi:MAG TPA: PAS domain S-box protein [Spirochaetota bacterium]|nr:PAS domain S-box protein [Spirochaetota bacterium]